MNKINSNRQVITNEGISGVYPELSMAKEFGSAMFLSAILILPYIFSLFRQHLSADTIKKIANEVVSHAKSDTSKESLKIKISRAIDRVIQSKMPADKAVSVQQDALKALPDDLEGKTEDTIKKETKSRLENLVKRGPRYNFRG